MARTRTRSDKTTEPAPQATSGFLAIGVGVVIALAVVVFMLYEPMRNWYAAWRTNLRLHDSYAEVLDEQSELQGDVDHLRTREGIEDEARRQGLVGDGETRVVIENYPEDTTTADSVPEKTVDDPWYLEFLDSVFGFEG